MSSTKCASVKMMQMVWVLCLSAILAAAEDAIPWYRNLEEASRAAQAANKPMLLDFWADWCAPCKIMEKEVYADQSVVAAAGKLVFVKIDFDRETALARKYFVNSLPLLVFTDSYGTELFRHRGFLNAGDLRELIQALPGDVSEINRLSRILSQDKEDFDALRGMAKQLRAAGLFQVSNEYYAKTLKRSRAKQDSGERESILIEMGLNHLALREPANAAKVLERCLKEFPNSPNKPDLLLSLARAYRMEGKTGRARELLTTLVRDHPGTEASQTAAVLLADR